MFVNFVSAIFILAMGLILTYKSEFFKEFEDYMQTKIWHRELSKEKDLDQRLKSIQFTGKVFLVVGIVGLFISIVQYFTL